MSIKKLSFMLLGALSLTALLGGCGSDNKEGYGLGPGGVAKIEETQCRVCHAASIDSVSKTAIVQDFIGTPTTPPSIHYQLPNGEMNTVAGCQGCHGGGAQHNGVGPLPYPNPLTASRCNAAECHNNKVPSDFMNGSVTFVNDCAECHSGTGVHSAGFAIPPGLAAGTTAKDLYNNCIKCHAVGQERHSDTMVDDNNGVRAITGEFAKWSHHVTGVNLQNAHCAACHLEGTVSADGTAIVVDRKYHMADDKTHLRNADTDADIQWAPNAPSFTNMDNFCLSCHDADGATSPKSAAIRAVMTPAAGKTASAKNPFADTISNQYDLMERPAVVDAKSQFSKGNNSHHAVLGKKYTGRTRSAVAGPRTVDTVAFASNSSAAMPGARKTIFDAGKFNGTYVTLADVAGETDVAQSLSGRNGGTTLGDDSTLHCGDCHTVGQYRAADVNVKPFNKAVIGAHGSNNEYLLRNNLGTDERHTGAKFAGSAGFGADIGYGTMPYLVCFNCHAFSTYGSAFAVTGVAGGHAGEYDQDGRCNGAGQTINNKAAVVAVGEERLKTYNADEVKYGTFDGSNFGNIFGIECNNCHNSGVKGNIFGGIHGSKVQTYEDGMGNETKHNRFMPGLGNTMYVPGTKGGFIGGIAKVYKAYSSNRLTGAALVQTELPVRTIRVTGVDNANGSYTYISGGVSNDLNWEQREQQSIAGQTDLQAKAMGCYTLSPNPTALTGSDARWTAAMAANVAAGKGSNWQPAFVNPTQAAIAAPAGTQSSPKVVNLQVNGFPADEIRYSATYKQTANDGSELFDVWGGCDDHNGAQGAGTGMVRKVLRKVTY